MWGEKDEWKGKDKKNMVLKKIKKDRVDPSIDLTIKFSNSTVDLGFGQKTIDLRFFF